MRRPAGGALAALVISTLLLTLAGAGTAREQGGAPAAQTPSVELRLLAQTPWVAVGGSFDVELNVGAAPDDAVVQVRVLRDVADLGRDRFEQTLRGENLPGVLKSDFPALPLALLRQAAPHPGSISLSFPVVDSNPPPFGLQLDEGVYPFEVTLVASDGTEIGSLLTYLVRLPARADGGTPLGVSVVMPIASPPAYQPDGSISMPAEEQARLRTVVNAIAAAPSVPLSIDVNPETLEVLSELDDQQRTSTVASLRSHLGGRELLADTYVPLDFGRWAASDNPDADIELVRQLKLGDETVLRLLGAEPARTSWSADTTMTPQMLTRLRDGGAENIVVFPSQVSEEDPVVTPTQTFDVLDDQDRPLRAAMVDDTLMSRLTATGDPVLNAHLTMADMAVTYFAQRSVDRSVVLQLPSNVALPPETYSALFDGFARADPSPTAAPVVRPMTLTDAFASTTPAPASRGRVVTKNLLFQEPAPLQPLLDAVTATRADIASFASMVGNGPGGQLVAYLDRQVLVSEANGFDATQRGAYLSGVHDTIGVQIGAVIAPADQQVTITGASGRIPVVVENRLEYPVDVAVSMSSAKLEFPEGDTQTVTLAPASTTRLEFSVDSRASGAFPVDVAVRSPDQRLVLGTSRYTVRSTAISGIGLAISIAAGVFLLAWWARHHRGVRRARRLVASNHPTLRTEAGDGSTAEEGPGATLRQDPTD